MKKSLIVVAAVVAPALMVVAQPGKDKQQPAAAPGGTPAAQPSKAAAPASKADSELTGQVEKVWAAISKQDWETFGSMLSDDFILVMGMGTHDKAGSIEGLKGMKMKSSKLSEWKTIRLNENAAVVVYKAESVWAGPDGKDMTDVTMCSDAMARHGGKWLISMHQETAFKAPAAQP